MAPEALQNPPQYNEKLDVFSFGNVILHTLTQEWPDPDPPTKDEGDHIIGLSELQRRERYIAVFTEQEKQLFLRTVQHCCENRPDKRPSSVMLVQELGRIESSLLTGSHVATPYEQLHRQLSTKEEECRQKDEALREKDATIKALRTNSQVRRQKLTIDWFRSFLMLVNFMHSETCSRRNM